MVSGIQAITDFQSLSDKYQFFLFDQYGVLHDGIVAYPGMRSVLLNLKQQGVTIGVISNSGKRASVNAERLARFGYGSDLIDRVWTSGELAWRVLTAVTQDHSAVSDDNVSVFYLGNDQDRSALQGLPVTEVENPASADFVLIAGVGLSPGATSDHLRIDHLQGGQDQGNNARDYYRKLLQPAAEKGVPAYCSNPDLLSLVGNSQVVDGPGTIARLYQELGAPCTFFGKPHVEIYQSILQDMGIQANQTLCIGDSLEHDIEGAAVAGCDSLLVSTGIYERLGQVEFLDKLENAAYKPNYIYGDRAGLIE